MDELDDELKRWVKIFNKGYAGVFNYETAEDKAIVELNTAREWCRSVAAEFGVTAAEPEHNPQDPPDCYVWIKEQRLSVELVQLVEAKHKARATKNETPYAGQLFLDMQWSRERFAHKLRECVQKKGHKYAQTGLRIDVLIVHTDETWLTSTQARDWLGEIEINPHANVASAFLLFFHEPRQQVFRLYGEGWTKK
jgi:hypothetical protein